MPSLPQPGVVTICEINCDFITAESLSDGRAKEAYGDILGVVFSPIHFRPEAVLSSQHQEGNDRTSTNGFAAFKEILSSSFKRVFPSDLNLVAEVISQGLSWHPHKPLVAFISGSNQITVQDYEDSEGKDSCILTSEAQRDVQALEWRPNSGKTVCVACKGGICIWSASYPGNVPSVRSGVTSSLGTASRGSGVRWILVDFLQSDNGEHISAISCSPDGRYLASASCESSSFSVWDLAQGEATPVRRGLGATSMLKWSPTGDYLLSTKSDGTFYLWETNTWTSELWSSTSGYVTGAAWDPEGRMVLLAFSESDTLGSLHFTSRPPALEAHLLPVEFPEITSLLGSRGIEKLAWDASGERLALSFRNREDMHSGLIAVYDVKRTPLISPSLIGFIRGPGENPKPLAFSFYSKFKQGPLLSVVRIQVSRSGFVVAEFIHALRFSIKYIHLEDKKNARMSCSAGAVGFAVRIPLFSVHILP